MRSKPCEVMLLANVAGGLVREKRLGRGLKDRLSFFEFSVHQWTEKLIGSLHLACQSKSGKYASCLVQQIVTFLNEFIQYMLCKTV